MNTQEIKHLAKLSSLEISDSELDFLTQELDAIISMVDELQAVDTEGMEPLFHPIQMIMALSQPLRQDCVTESNSREQNMKSAPAQQSGLFLVPKVIE
ncbi:MAG: Asp-tRNA(Asn)/Glu-tRNA(Gln) amidotransferase subunit GatC [Betaproteobacteria bacterium]|jgi:aspartyl-tRNA(Asn)/glutamyl-tRNA(Gln) amidotransferase subunit C